MNKKTLILLSLIVTNSTALIASKSLWSDETRLPDDDSFYFTNLPPLTTLDHPYQTPAEYSITEMLAWPITPNSQTDAQLLEQKNFRHDLSPAPKGTPMATVTPSIYKQPLIHTDLQEPL